MKKFAAWVFCISLFIFVIMSCGSTPTTNNDSQQTSHVEETKEMSKVEKVKAALDKAPEWVMDNGESANTPETICKVITYYGRGIEGVIAGELSAKGAIENELRWEMGSVEKPQVVDYSIKDLWYLKFTDTLFLLGCADRKKSKEETVKKMLGDISEGIPQWVLDSGANATNSEQICGVGKAKTVVTRNPTMKKQMLISARNSSIMAATDEIAKKIKTASGLKVSTGGVRKSDGNISGDLNFDFTYEDHYIKINIIGLVKDTWETPDSRMFYTLACSDREQIKFEIREIETQSESEDFSEAPQWIKDGSASTADTPEKICAFTTTNYMSHENAENSLKEKLLIKIGKEYGFFIEDKERQPFYNISTKDNQIVFRYNNATLTLPASDFVYKNKDIWHFKAAEQFVAFGCLDREKIQEAIKKTYDETGNNLTWSERSSNEMNWQSAQEYCENLTENGFDDWKLPTIDELRTLVKDRRTASGRACRVGENNKCLTGCWSWDTCAEACDGNWNKCSGYDDGRYSKLGDGKVKLWSSSIKPDETDFAWNVDFYNGSVSNSDKSKAIRYVRCVRKKG